ncbi:MAG: serine/threonine-protein kinase [Enhygromyxa sp.]
MPIDWLDDDELAAIDAPIGPEDLAEYERLMAARQSRAGPPRVRLAPDLDWLEKQITDVKIRRRVARHAAGGDDPTIAAAIPPFMFDRFETIEIVRGGMGLVIKARDPKFNRLVGIKLLLRPGPDGPSNLMAEARALAKIKHPNVVAVYEPGEWNDRVFFVMEWIEGVDGQQWMTQKRRSWQEVRRVFIAAGRGLAAAHAVEIHHRDFKPSNMLIGHDGRVVVADFGVASSLHSSPAFDGRLAGTPLYMAPERVLGMRGDARADQFSFCATMWTVLHGRHPFTGETVMARLEAMEHGEVWETLGHGVPRWLCDVVRKGLAYDPEDRYVDMHALLAALIGEPPEASGVDDDEHDDGVVVVDERVLHKHRGEAPPPVPKRGLHFVIGGLSSLVMLMGLMLWMRAPMPEPAAPAVVSPVPYHVALELVAADEFVEAEEYWRDHRSELSDEEALRIARFCLARSRELGRTGEGGENSPASAEQRTQAKRAAVTAWVIASHVTNFGKTPERRDEGGRLAAEARPTVGRPGSD